MSVPLRSSDFESYSAYDEDDFYTSEFELSPGERIGAPVSRANDVLAWCVAIATVVGGGWVMMHDEGALLTRMPDLAARVSNAVAGLMPAPGASVPNETAASAALALSSAQTPPASAAPAPKTSSPSRKPASSSSHAFQKCWKCRKRRAPVPVAAGFPACRCPRRLPCAAQAQGVAALSCPVRRN